MAHQDYSQICPIFKEGVEKELVIPLNLSASITTVPCFVWNPGREVTVMEGYANVYLSTGKSVSASFSIQLFKNQSLSLTSPFGSIDNGRIEMSNAPFPLPSALGYCQTSGSITSTNFTSTDFLIGAFTVEPPGGNGVMNPHLIIRYREK
jgi:hypothetical protein